MVFGKVQQFAVIGAGSAAAHALTQAGHSVHLFDKSRGPGGRLATRRVDWVDRLGQACMTRLDHGAVGITSRSAAFQAFVDEALRAGWLAEWAPRLAAGNLPHEDGDRLYVPAPDMPSLCRRLLDGAAATWFFAVDGLHKGPLGWQVQAGGERHPKPFDAVVLALPRGQRSAPAESCWWGAAQGLGVCGDSLAAQASRGLGCLINRCPRRCCSVHPVRRRLPLNPPPMKRHIERLSTSLLDRFFPVPTHDFFDVRP